MHGTLRQRPALNHSEEWGRKRFILTPRAIKMQAQNPPVTLLRKPAVLARVGIPKSTWERGVRLGLYPKPIKIGLRAVAWTSTSIDKLIEDLTAQAAE